MQDGQIGISPQLEIVYRTLLHRYRWHSSDLAAALGWSPADMADAIEEMRAEGLVTPSAEDPDHLRAVEPRLALPMVLVRRLRAPIGRTMPTAGAVERFIVRHERTTDRAAAGGMDQVTVLVERFAAGARQDVIALAPRYAPGGFEFSRQIASTVIRRGGTLRLVCGLELLSLPSVEAHARWLGARHAAPRAVGWVPVRAIIIDHAIAVVVDGESATVVRTGAPLDSLCRLANRLWERAPDVRAAGAALVEPDTEPRGEAVLRLLAAGLTDDAVARRIGVSVRTVRTEVAALMASLDARSRFQAGLRAAEVGLL